MAVAMFWDTTYPNLLRIEAAEQWQWPEFWQAWENIKPEMDKAEQKFDIIIDVRQSNHIPPNTLANLKWMTDRAHVNYSRRTVYVGVGAMGAAMNSVFSRLHGRLLKQYQLFFVNTLEEAYPLLQNRDEG
jgi:hypothetical protein